MHKATMCGTAVLLVALIAWAGGDPWKTKPYQQWNDEDIQKVFTASPWTQKVTVEGTWKPVTSVEAANGTLNAGGAGGAKGMGGAATVLPAEADVNAGTRGPSVPFVVYWMSSETMRAALARRGVLHAGKNEADAEKYVETPMDDYQIAVQGPDMAPFYHNEEKFFETHAALEVKKTKQTAAPSKVVYNRDDKGAITSAIFFFPKKVNGQDFISPNDKSIEFTCKLGNSTMHAVFEPSKMVNQKGADL